MHTARSRPAAALFLLGALAGPVVAQDAPRGVVRGVVLGAADSLPSPLPHAMVELVEAGRRRVVLADGLGRYLLREVAPGLVRIRALHVGHEPGQVEVLVPSGASVAVDLELVRRPVEMPEFTVLAGGVTVPDVSPRDLRVTAPAWAASEVALRTLAEGTGMAEAGVLRAVGGEGWGGDPSDPRDVLLMRGSTTDLKLVLLDGAPVYTPFHLGGLLPSFDATTMGGAALHVGGAPARYDGGLSYILDLRTRLPRRDRLRGGGALDLMSGQASVEGPLGERAGLLLAGRALHDGAALVWGGAGSPYGYADALLRFDAEPAAGHRLGVTAFANHESVFLDLASTIGLSGPDAARWGNEVVSAVYQGVAGATELDVTVAGSRYRAELPVHPAAENVAAGSADPIVGRGETERLRVAVDATRPLSGGALRLGGTVDRLGVSYGARRLAGGAPPSADAGAAGVVVGAYVDWTARASGSLAVRTGLRADRFSAGAGLRWAPRLSLHWSLSETALLTLAAGRYQYTRASDDRVRGRGLGRRRRARHELGRFGAAGSGGDRGPSRPRPGPAAVAGRAARHPGFPQGLRWARRRPGVGHVVGAGSARAARGRGAHRLARNTLNKSVPGTLDLRGGSSRAERDDRGGGRWSR